jgi:hypothetical protein
MQKQNVVVRLPNRMLRKLQAFEEREDLPDRTTSIIWLLWKGLRDYEKKEGVTLGGKKAGK